MQTQTNVTVLWPSKSIEERSSHPLFILIFSLIVCSGLIFNFFVIYRMCRLRIRDRDQFLNGTGVYLLAMALCDVSSILLSYLQMSFTYFPEYSHTEFLPIFCKVSEFLHRCCYTYSMYCWLFMSGLRYCAAFQPMDYSTVWKSPETVLFPTGIASIILNLYLMTAVSGSADKCGCVIQMDQTVTMYSTADIIVSTCIPGFTILALDLQVLCCRTRRKSSDVLQVVFHRLDEESTKPSSTMRRFMIVTAIGMGLCIPDGILRGVRPFFDVGDNLIIFYTCKALYLAKFSCNAFYLSIFVFDRNVMSKTSSSRHLSISARRLEEEPAIVPRERSRTLSCRGTPPFPLLTRNSSCILYQAPPSPSKLWV